MSHPAMLPPPVDAPARSLPLIDGERYAVETTSGAVFVSTEWSQLNLAFRLNARGGIPLSKVVRVAPVTRVGGGDDTVAVVRPHDWHRLGECSMPARVGAAGGL